MDDRKMETIVGRMLQAGVLAAGATMLVGGAYYLRLHGGEMPDYRHFHGVTPRRGQRIIQAGVLIMIGTPVLRVAFAAAAFAMERDWMYTTISLIVLGLLIYALFG